MDVRERVKKRFEKAHREARKQYERGDMARARMEYAECARQLRLLAGLSSPVEREDLLERARKFEEVVRDLGGGEPRPAEGQQKPPEEERAAVRKTDGEERRDEISDLILAGKPAVSFEDIAGLDEVKENIKEAIIYPFMYPEEYRHFGVKPGGGILLYGPPGCGKTMLAAAAAAESDAVFINLKTSDIKNKYVGESERNVRDVFALAAEHPRAIMFFDEIDALGGERSALTEGHERSLVSELLAQMDGLESKGGERSSLVLAATNRPWDVDIALRRSGRFETTIFIPHPDFEARRRVFDLNLRDKPVSASVDLDRLAAMTEGYSSAEIADVCRKAAMIPLRERISQNRPRRELGMPDFEQVLRKKATVLASWYARTLKELAGKGDAEMFADLVKAAREYRDGR